MWCALAGHKKDVQVSTFLSILFFHAVTNEIFIVNAVSGVLRATTLRSVGGE